MKLQHVESWGRFPRTRAELVSQASRFEALPPVPAGITMLPYGRGRSYGDSCLNDGQRLVGTRLLDRFIALDDAAGVLRCEAGMGFDDLLRTIVPRGWFPPVTPGTKFITVGGAIANDIHGKNHHRVGTFGHFVERLELLRSDGTRTICSPTDHPELFRATVGGLGLTGLITWAEFRLRRIANPWIVQEAVRFDSLDECLRITAQSNAQEYTVAWMDCLATGKQLGRGVYFLGAHAAEGAAAPRTPAERSWLTVPIDLPTFALNRATVRAFNSVYRAFAGRPGTRVVHYEPFFYPLDGVGHWNRVYGRRGLAQWQCVVPDTDGGAAMRAILTEITRAGIASFLAVFKTFGTMAPAGMLSFPRAGHTLALDFAVQPKLFPLLDRLDAIVREARGAVYPAKDARMSAASFQAFFPRWQEFSRHIDPAFSSSFWRRVTSDAA